MGRVLFSRSGAISEVPVVSQGEGTFRAIKKTHPKRCGTGPGSCKKVRGWSRSHDNEPGTLFRYGCCRTEERNEHTGKK